MPDRIWLLFQPPWVYWVGAGAVVALVGLLLLARYLNRRYVLLYRSAGTDQITYELARIANALELLAASPKRVKPLPRSEERTPVSEYGGGVGYSMFGR